MRRIGAAVAAVAVLGAGLAYAATGIVGSDGVVHGCYATSGGALRLVAAGARCRSSEHAVSWNQVGQPGPAGPQGPPGVPGQRPYVVAYSGAAPWAYVRVAPGDYAVSGTVTVACVDSSSPAPGSGAFVTVYPLDPNDGNVTEAFAERHPQCAPGTTETFAIPPTRVGVSAAEELGIQGGENGIPASWTAHLVVQQATPTAANEYR